MGFAAVVLARFAAGLFRVGLGWSFGEGRGLTFAGAVLLIELGGEALDLGAEIGDFAFEATTLGA